MKPDKYSRRVSVQCPTCGSSLFESEEQPNLESARMTCVGCDREFTREQLLEANQENVQAHADEIAEEVTNDVVKKLRRDLKKAFKGNRHISFE